MESFGLGAIIDSENDSDSWHKISQKAELTPDEFNYNPCASIVGYQIGNLPKPKSWNDLEVHLLDAPLKVHRTGNQKEQLASEGLAEVRDRKERLIFEEHESGSDSEASIADLVEIDHPEDNLVAEIDHENNVDLLALQDEEEN